MSDTKHVDAIDTAASDVEIADAIRESLEETFAAYDQVLKPKDKVDELVSSAAGWALEHPKVAAGIAVAGTVAIGYSAYRIVKAIAS